ncbi:hypothetical protein LEMLEM_LOCUS25128, partial [Lemmus lemmus]
KASPWEAGLLEGCTGPPHPDPQGNVSVLNTDHSLHVSATWRKIYGSHLTPRGETRKSADNFLDSIMLWSLEVSCVWTCVW